MFSGTWHASPRGEKRQGEPRNDAQYLRCTRRVPSLEHQHWSQVPSTTSPFERYGPVSGRDTHLAKTRSGCRSLQTSTTSRKTPSMTAAPARRCTWSSHRPPQIIGTPRKCHGYGRHAQRLRPASAGKSQPFIFSRLTISVGTRSTM